MFITEFGELYILEVSRMFINRVERDPLGQPKRAILFFIIPYVRSHGSLFYSRDCICVDCFIFTGQALIVRIQK